MKRLWSMAAISLGILACVPLVLAAKSKARTVVSGAKKKKGLDPKAVAQNELLDKKYLAVLRKGIQQLNAGQLDAAIKAGQKALQMRPQSGRPLVLMATGYKMKKLYNSAIQYYRQAAKRFNGKKVLYEKSQALYNVAFCFELMGQRPNAIGAWQIYVQFVSSFHIRNSRVGFARQRITALQSVKGPPAKR